MDRIDRNVVGVFKRSLNNLQFSKMKDINQRDHLILDLKSLAFEDLSYRDDFVEAIRAQSDMADIKTKILIIKLIFAIVSTIKGEYKGLFDEHIVDIVFSAYAHGDDMIKTELFDMREKWDPYFSKAILIELDNTIRNVDKRWLNSTERPKQIALHKEKIALLNEIERLKKDRNLARAQMKNGRQGYVNTPKIESVIQKKLQQTIITVPNCDIIEKDLSLSDDSEIENESQALKLFEVQLEKDVIQQSRVKEQIPAIEKYDKDFLIPSKPEANKKEESNDESSCGADDDGSSNDSSNKRESESEEKSSTVNKSTKIETRVATNVVVPTLQTIMHIPNSIPMGFSINESLPVIEKRTQCQRNCSQPKILKPNNRPSGNASMPRLEKRSHAIVNPSRYRPKEMIFVTKIPINKAIKRSHATVKASQLKKSSMNKELIGVENRLQAIISKPNVEIREEIDLKRKRDQEEIQQWQMTLKQQEIALSSVHVGPPRKIHCSPHDVRRSKTPSADDDEVVDKYSWWF